MDNDNEIYIRGHPNSIKEIVNLVKTKIFEPNGVEIVDVKPIYISRSKDKEKQALISLIKQRRRYTRLSGHLKENGMRQCSCGCKLLLSNKHSSGWICPNEQKEWDYIEAKLKTDEIDNL